MIITDPRTIPVSDGPMVVSKGGGTDLASRLIRWRTNSWCEHSMLFNQQGKFVWEGPMAWYGEGQMEDYMKSNICLKFYQLVNMNAHACAALNLYITNRIKSPWWEKSYDWLGIVGEAIGLPKIHTPGLEYCSVDAIHALKFISQYMPTSYQLVINAIPNEENPGYLDRVMVNYPLTFKFYGIYQG